MNNVFRSLRIGDAAVIVLALALALVPLLFVPGGGQADYAVVSVNGVTIYRAPLIENARVQAGSGNAIVIRNGEISMAEARCPDGICLGMHAGRPGESVICLPNKVAAWVEGEGELDGLSY